MRFWSLIFSVLICFNAFVWYQVILHSQDALDVYFLDVGQGDSQLIVLPGGVKVLIDGGPDKGVLFELSNVLPETDRYIDIVVITHPELDHFGGIYDVAERYKIGALAVSGREGESDAWRDLLLLLKDKEIPILKLGAGDAIKYEDSVIMVLSPNKSLMSNKEVNETSLVLGLNSEGVRALFTGDIGFTTENYITDEYDIDVDILKVAHHGSKFSTGMGFLLEATPEISVIQVGKNRFGHPTQATLSRLQSIGSSIYRNDENGTVHVTADDGIIGVSVARK